MLDLDELAPVCADLYGDVYAGLGRMYVGRPVPDLPEAKTERRGRQLALVLKKLGWTDSEIVAMVSLGAGVISDFSHLHALREEAKATTGAAS